MKVKSIIKIDKLSLSREEALQLYKDLKRELGIEDPKPITITKEVIREIPAWQPLFTPSIPPYSPWNQPYWTSTARDNIPLGGIGISCSSNSIPATIESTAQGKFFISEYNN